MNNLCDLACFLWETDPATWRSVAARRIYACLFPISALLLFLAWFVVILAIIPGALLQQMFDRINEIWEGR